VAARCPRSLRRVLVSGPSDALLAALRAHGLEPTDSDSARCGATLALCNDSPSSGCLRSARAALAPRGRAWFVVPHRALARSLLSLAAHGLHPKHARITAGPDPRVILTAMPGKPGGLVVEILPMC